MKKTRISQIALYRKDGKFLLQHRDKNATNFPNMWGFFGGHVESGETFEEAIRRETMEELEYPVNRPRFFHEFIITRERETFHKKSFMEEYDSSQKLVLHEGDKMGWYTPEEAKKLNINPWNIDTVEALKKELDFLNVKFQPSQWHSCKKSDWNCSKGVNCYAYALNNPDYYWAVPGSGFAHTKTKKYFTAFNKMFEKTSIASFQKMLKQGAKHDGLLSVKKPVKKDGYYLAALFFPKGERDFHWYRQDDDGTWSHKIGYMRPTNKDEKGKRIKNPLSADRGEYSIFGGYFLVPRGGVIIEENKKLS